ncbi:MAG: hypothetical protein ACPG6B_01420 [Oceanihabitans sp.]
MQQNDIKLRVEQTAPFTIPEVDANWEELNARTAHSEDGFNSIEELAQKVKLLLQNNNQNTKRKLIPFTTTGAYFSAMVTGINATDTHEIANGELAVYQTTIINETDASKSLIYTINTREIGAGTYGAGGTLLTRYDLYIASIRSASNGEELDSTQIIGLPASTSTTVQAVFNSLIGFTVQDQADGLRLVNINLDSEDLQYFFIGAGGDYGVGGDLTATATDFILIGDTSPIIPKEEQIIGTATENLTVSGATNISLLPQAHSNLKLIGNAAITFTDTPAVGETLARSFKIYSDDGETLGIVNSTHEYGEYVTDGTEILVNVLASNTATEGLDLHVTFNEPI